MRFVRVSIVILMLFAGVSIGYGQSEPDGDARAFITAENVSNLQSVLQIDFGATDESYDEFNTGAVTVSPDGAYFAVVNGAGAVVVWDDDGNVAAVIDEEGDVLALTFSASGDVLATIRAELTDAGQQITASAFSLTDEDHASIVFESEGTPQEAWLDDGGIWIELFYPDSRAEIVYRAWDEAESLEVIPYGPGEDEDAIVRIGRIPSPFAVTSSMDGVVKQWNLQTSEVIAEAEVENGPAVFGQISPDGRYLAWRDPMSNQLNRLDFAESENVVVAELSGEYVQGYFMSPDGSVILGVDINFVPVVVAWIVETGERIDLGAYRECSRVPDLIRMSADGTTLVIGCDTGLDVWRIAEES